MNSSTPSTDAAPTSLLPSYALLIGAMAVVGAYVAMSKPLVAVFPVLLLAWLRFGIAAIFLLPWTFRKPTEPLLNGMQKKTLFLQSFFGNFLFSICMLSGIARTSAAAAGVILAAIPAATAVLSFAILSEKISSRAMIAVALAVVGVSLLALAKSDGGLASEVTWLGNALMMGATVCEALYVVFGRKLVAGLSPLRVSALINLCGFMLVTPFGIWQALSFNWAGPTLMQWLGLALYALAASVITVAMWMAGLKRVPASQAGVFTVALPISAAIVGVLVLNETIGVYEITALALAASGILVMATQPKVRDK
jgi:drug/metabolite transporter (DMT)-like permease